MEWLESRAVRPRQARYQAALRPDSTCPNYRALLRFLAARITKWGAASEFHGSRRKDGQLADLFAAFGGHILRAKADTYLLEKSCWRLAAREDPYVIVGYFLR